MSVILRCGTIVPGCAVVLHGKSEDDILIAILDHLKTAHNMDHVSVDFRQKLKTAIEPEETTQQARA
jgi:predicted small metal-binding protein